MRIILGVLCVVFCFSTFSESEDMISSVDGTQEQLRMNASKWFPVEAINMCGEKSTATEDLTLKSSSKYDDIVAMYEDGSFARALVQANMSLCEGQHKSRRKV